MTDNTSSIAGDYEGGIKITCILNEGAPTVTARTYGRDGTYDLGTTWASELKKGDVVAISNSTDVTYVACGGIPLVETPVTTETLVVGQIVSEPKLVVQPPTTASANELSERLAGKYYRVASVEIWGGITAIKKATVMCDGSNATVPGVGATLKYNITSGTSNSVLSFDSAASAGVGVIPFHYVPAGTDADTYSCLVGITGLMYAITGA